MRDTIRLDPIPDSLPCIHGSICQHCYPPPDTQSGNGKALARFAAEMLAETLRAQARFPAPNPSLAALTEEVGELAKAILDEPSENVYAEAVQVAAMAARCAIEGDPTLDTVREKTKAGIHPK